MTHSICRSKPAISLRVCGRRAHHHFHGEPVVECLHQTEASELLKGEPMRGLRDDLTRTLESTVTFPGDWDNFERRRTVASPHLLRGAQSQEVLSAI